MARAELDDLLHRYRRVWRRRHHQAIHVLHWPVPGSVWAMDFTEAPAAHRRPVSLPPGRARPGQRPATALAAVSEPPPTQASLLALASLFAVHGAPLVLKIDNGSAFGAEATLAFLAQCRGDSAVLAALYATVQWSHRGRHWLFENSNRTTPAGHGRPGHWTRDDVAAARLEANATARPAGPNGPTPDQPLAATAAPSRPKHGTSSKPRFSVAARKLATNPTAPGTLRPPLTERDQRRLDRQALRRALEEHGYLHYTRRRIPLPIKGKKVANIT